MSPNLVVERLERHCSACVPAFVARYNLTGPLVAIVILGPHRHVTASLSSNLVLERSNVNLVFLLVPLAVFLVLIFAVVFSIAFIFRRRLVLVCFFTPTFVVFVRQFAVSRCSTASSRTSPPSRSQPT